MWLFILILETCFFAQNYVLHFIRYLTKSVVLGNQTIKIHFYRFWIHKIYSIPLQDTIKGLTLCVFLETYLCILLHSGKTVQCLKQIAGNRRGCWPIWFVRDKVTAYNIELHICTFFTGSYNAVWLIDPWEIWMKFYTCNFQIDFNDWWLRHLLWNCPNMNVIGLHWWSVSIGLGNGLVLADNKPLPEPMLTQISFTIWRYLATYMILHTLLQELSQNINQRLNP